MQTQAPVCLTTQKSMIIAPSITTTTTTEAAASDQLPLIQETMIATQCTFMLCGKGSQAYEKTRGASETKKSNNMGPGDGGGGHLVGLQCSQYEEACGHWNE